MNEPSHKKKRKDQEKSTDPKAPSFFETHYYHNYLNWGSNDEVPSMKPQAKPAVTNIPFQANSIYRTEFSAKALRNEKKNSTLPVKPKEVKKQKKSYCSKILFTTTHKDEFKTKSFFKDESFKPEIKTTNSGISFHGRTEYQGKFNGQKK